MPAKYGRKEVSLLCRRFIDWDNINFLRAEQDTHFGKTHPFEQLRHYWNNANPNITLEKYRGMLHRIASKTWKDAGMDIFVNPVGLTQDSIGSMEKETIHRLREYDWIIPIDDDDWTAPELCNHLRDISPGERMPCIAYWNPASVHFSIGRAILHEKIGPFLPSDPRIIYSCGYAISKNLFSKLDDSVLEDVLMHHGPASQLAKVHSSTHVNSLLAVHLRHVATAGSASQAEINRTVGKISTPKINNKDISGINFWLDPPTDFNWALNYWIQLQENHSQINALTQ